MRLWAWVRNEVEAWRRSADVDLIAEHHSLRHYLAVGAFCAIFAAIATWSPLGRHVGLDLTRFLAHAVPPWFVLVLVTAVPRERPPSTVELLLCGPLVVLLASSFLLSSNADVALMLAAMVTLTLIVHGHIERATPRRPLLLLVDSTALLLCLLTAPTPKHRMALVVMTLAGVAAGLLVGSAADGAVRARAAQARLREALAASQRSALALEFEGRLLASRANAHDIRSQLTSALAGATMARDLVGDQSSTDSELAQLLEATVGALERAAALSNEGRLEHRPTLVAVAVESAVAEVLAGIRMRFPETKIEVQGEQGVRAWVDAGPLTLARLVENVVVNACEGNGEARARHVIVRCQLTELDACVTIDDDGPGFAVEQLTQAAASLGTTKRNGTGLGLYTVERLVHASGGRMTRDNRPEGGARVQLWLQPVRCEEES